MLTVSEISEYFVILDFALPMTFVSKNNFFFIFLDSVNHEEVAAINTEI